MSKLFSNLEIRNFRAFDHLLIEKLGQVNLFIGKNNIGKSSLLEALLLYANLGAPDIILKILSDREDLLVHQSSNAKTPVAISQSVWNLFNGYPEVASTPSGIEIGAVNSPDSSLRLSIGMFTTGVRLTTGEFIKPIIPTIFPVEITGDVPHDELVPALIVKLGTFLKEYRLDENLEEHARRWHLQPRTILDLVLPTQYIGPNRISREELPKLWNNVALTQLKRDIVESLQIIYPAIIDVALLITESSKNPSVHVQLDTTGGSVPLKSLGDGMNRLFGLTLALVNAQNGMLLVDEIENGLHYSVIPFVWKFILKVAKRLNIQVFATTHSMDCIRAFHLATKDDLNIEGVATRIEYKKSGFKTSQFDENRLSTIIEEDIEIR